MNSKKRKHNQTFIKDYETAWPVLKKSKLSSSHAYCTVCCIDFLVSHGGREDCRRHCESARHIKYAKAKASTKSLDFYSKNETGNGLNIIRAEAFFTKFLIEHNCPLAVADHAGPLFRKMFPDSTVAKDYACARTKTTAIVKSFASDTPEKLVSKLRQRKFSLATDGSNALQDKLFPLVVTYYDDEMKKIVTSLLSLPRLEIDATGENIFNLLNKELEKKKIPWSNCVSFGADNANVMLGQFKGVSAFISKMNPKIIIRGCVCHLIHLAAQHSAEKLDEYDIEQFLIDVYYYLKKSVKRLQLLQSCQTECKLKHHKILKYGATRWLSLGDVVDRFLEQWDALHKFFCEAEKGSSATFFKLKGQFENPITKLYYFCKQQSQSSTKKIY